MPPKNTGKRNKVASKPPDPHLDAASKPPDPHRDAALRMFFGKKNQQMSQDNEIPTQRDSQCSNDSEKEYKSTKVNIEKHLDQVDEVVVVPLTLSLSDSEIFNDSDSFPGSQQSTPRVHSCQTGFSRSLTSGSEANTEIDDPEPLRSGNFEDEDFASDEIKDLYTTSAALEKVTLGGKDNPIYGRFTMNSFASVLAILKSHCSLDRKTTRFIDLGSGMGMPALHAAPFVEISIGIENVKLRKHVSIRSLSTFLLFKFNHFLLSCFTETVVREFTQRNFTKNTFIRP
jgi:hypothetical protein